MAEDVDGLQGRQNMDFSPLSQLLPMIVHFYSARVLYAAHYIIYCCLLDARALGRVLAGSAS